MNSVQIAQKSYEMPQRAMGSPLHFLLPSPTSTDRLASMKRSSAAAF